MTRSVKFNRIWLEALPKLKENGLCIHPDRYDERVPCMHPLPCPFHSSSGEDLEGKTNTGELEHQVDAGAELEGDIEKAMRMFKEKIVRIKKEGLCILPDRDYPGALCMHPLPCPYHSDAGAELEGDPDAGAELEGNHDVRTEISRRYIRVNWFAEEMKRKLEMNHHKGGWEDDKNHYLIRRLLEEVTEFVQAVMKKETADIIIGEAADVANFCMMIADNRCAPIKPRK